jgi:hypothetical protein
VPLLALPVEEVDTCFVVPDVALPGAGGGPIEVRVVPTAEGLLLIPTDDTLALEGVFVLVVEALETAVGACSLVGDLVGD